MIHPRLLLVASLVLSVGSGVASAQLPSAPMRYQQAFDGSSFLAKTTTEPVDDSVMLEAPVHLSLQFPQRVRLVKLTLRNEKRDWVDIDFRYDPQPDSSFAWSLPVLAAADYYIADWAVLGANDQLVRGSFSFSFGVDAKPPSIHREIDELLLQLRYGDPEVRTVMPPRTEIIINRDPPQYDPPFTIKLDSTTQTPC